MVSQTSFKINWDYLPIKAHYFFLYGGCGSTVSFMQVIAKELGISPVAVGIIFTLVPLCVWISKPVFGFITDKVKNIRNILIILLIVTAITFFAVLYVPPIQKTEIFKINVTAACNEVRDELVIYLSRNENDSSCNKEITKKEYDCELTSHSCHSMKNITLRGTLSVTSILRNNHTENTSFFFKLHEKNISKQECICLEQNMSSFVCEPDFYICSSFGIETFSEYELYNFWIFMLLAVISGAGAGTMWSLTDAACNEILKDKTHKYGKQRLWGTISWGIATFAAGIFNDIATSKSKHNDYSPGFYLMLAFFAIDMFILCFFRVEKAHTSMNICKDVRKIFSSMRTIAFAIGVYICGSLSGLLWTYQFWFLTELGSKPLLLGLVAGIQCIAAEVPFFFFSGWFIKKIGHFYCLIAALAVFALRMGIYSALHDAWWVLPVELLHGVTFAIFFSAMTLYAVDYAAPGTEATMIGIFGGIFEGLGVATGSLLGGLGFGAIGGHWTFFVASMISLNSAVILMLFNIFILRSGKEMILDKNKTVSMKEIVKSTSQDNIQ